ncbi:MAG: hypothetical protein D6790_19225 [Caldilineae bacterium]|nr:MAG: hypothetical protein D6790_19225 [Caldilineae bacterium]
MATTVDIHAFLLEHIRKYYEQWGTMASRIPNFHLITQYVNGEQPTDVYRKQLSISELSGEHTQAINWRPVSVLDPIQRIAAARVMRKLEEVVAVPVDAYAYDEENRFFSRMKARLLLKKELMAAGADVDQLPSLEGEPETMEELEVLVSNGLKHRLAKDYEDAVRAVMMYSGLDEQRNEIIADLFHYGVAGWKHYVDSRGLLRVRRVPPGRIVAPPTSSLDWSDAPAIGEEMTMTFGELLTMFPDITDRQAEEILGAAVHHFDGQRHVSREEQRVRVVYMEVRGSEIIGIDRRRTSYGDEVVRYVTGDRAAKAPTTIRMDRIYGGYWVVGTEVLLGYGEVLYTPRQVSSFDKARFTYELRALKLVGGLPKGMAVDAIPYVDAFHIAWYKMQQTIATMRPNALFIDATALIGVPLRDKDRPVTPKDLLDLFAHKNVLVGRLRDEYGRSSGAPAAMPINTSDERAFMALQASMINAIDNIRRLYGLNSLTDASTPDPDTLTTIAKLADQGTSNALFLVERADRVLMSRLYQGVADRVAVMLRRGAKSMSEFMRRAIGKSSTLLIENERPFFMYDVGMTIEDAPDIEERQGLEEAMNAAVREGMLTPADIAFVRSIRDPSQAKDIMEMRILRNRRRAQEESMRLQQMNAELQDMVAQRSHQRELERLRAEAEMKIYVYQQTEGAVKQAELQLDAQELEIEAAKAAAVIEQESVNDNKDKQ